MPDQKNMANSSISTSDIEQMVRAANDLKQAFKDVNSELNKMNHALGKTTHSDNGDTNINVNVKGSSGSRSSSSSGNSARAQKKARSILDMFNDAGADRGLTKFISFFKSGWAGAAVALWMVFFNMVKGMTKLAKELKQNLSGAQKDLAALGQSSKNLDTALGKDIKTTTEFNSKMKAAGTAIGATGNMIKGAFEKFINWLADTIPALSKFIDKLEHATAGIARRQSVASATMSLVGQGMKYGTAQTTASNVEAAAVAYLMKAYGVDANAARNSDDYKATVQAMAGLVTSGGINGMFNTSNVEGYGYSNGIWTPGVQYTDQYMSAMRSQMLADALDIYKEGGAEGLADWNNQLSKIQLLVSNMAGSLYSFDEVEQVSAVNLEDLDTTVSNMGTADDITSNDDDNTNREIDAYADITDDGAAKIENALNAAVEAIADIETEANAQLQGDLVTATEALEAALGLVAKEEKEGSTAVANGALAAAQSLANAANAAMAASANAITAEERAGYSTLASQLLSCSNAIIAAINAASASQLAIQQQASTAGLRFGSASASDLAAAREVAGLRTGSQASVTGARFGSSSASDQAAAKEIANRKVSDGSTLGAKSLDFTSVWKAYDDLAAYINRTAIYSDDYYRKDYLGQLEAGIQGLTSQQQIDNAAKAISEEKKRLRDFAKNGTADAIAEGLNGQNLPVWMQGVLGAGAAVFGSLGLTGAAGALAGTGAVGSAIAGAAGAGSGVWSIGTLIKDAMETLGGSGIAFGGSYATGGIGLSEVRGATLFEDGPEAVLPLNDAGADFMAYTMQKALTQLGDVSTVNHGNTYNINGVKYLDQAVLDKMLLDDHDRTAQLVGRRGY